MSFPKPRQLVYYVLYKRRISYIPYRGAPFKIRLYFYSLNSSSIFSGKRPVSWNCSIFNLTRGILDLLPGRATESDQAIRCAQSFQF